MCDLLYKLETTRLLSSQSTAYLLDLMRRCQTGSHRIRAGFPDDWVVADKTGTGRQRRGINVATNDVAVITGPDKSSYILSVFIADARLSRQACESKIAEVARAIHLSVR
jgi:beta-lactamase class A